MTEVFISLGSNLNNRQENLNKAIAEIRKLGRGLVQSSVYETAPWGNENQPVFLNQVIRLETGLSATGLMKKLLEIETSLGRKRTDERWQPRTIDLDILYYGEECYNKSDLVIPHPFLQDRLFVLEPLAEIAPQKVHPLLQNTSTELLRRLKNK